MKWLMILAAMTALVMARPETYKEQEDFQYSRSSSDDGTKSGYYGAQRGNMGGNYERAHNMDALAQNQMSGIVRQVEGELGDGANTRSGSVFSAANSRGIYGSGSLDTSNLQGRNFQEGTTYDDSHSSLTHSSAHNRASYSNSRSHNYGGYRRTTSDAQTQTDDLQSLDNAQTSNQQSYGSTRHSSGYQSQAGFQEQSQYGHDNSNSHSGYGSNIYTRLTPVRIIVTPGGRVALPVAVQTYDATHGSSVFNHNSLQSETDLTSDTNQGGSAFRPSNNRYYESSYRYNKKWEKHDTVPTSVAVVTPTESPIPKNSELYEDVDVHRAHSSSTSGRYNAAKSYSDQSDRYSNYDLHQQRANSNSDAFTQTESKSHLDHGFSSDSLNAYSQAQRNSESRYHGGAEYDSNAQSRYKANSNGQVEGLNTSPKSYQSSYSYHKSWERQGDPYVIKPASTTYSDSQASQRFTSATKNQGFATYEPRSQYSQSQRNCEDNCHIRVARSYRTDMEQQSQNLHDDQELSQQVQGTRKNFEDLSQQSQQGWDQETAGQQSQQGWDQETAGQQSLSQWDNSKDLSQQSQSTWDQQNVGQQSQNTWDKLEDLGQQSQTNWDQQQNVGQQSQNQWDNLENLGQQSQSNWDQQNVEQQTQNQGQNLEDFGQQSQSNWDQQTGQQTQNHGNTFENQNQQSQNNWDQQNIEQQTQNQGQNLENFGQQSQSNWDQQNVQTQNQGNTFENQGQQSQSNWDQLNVGQELPKRTENTQTSAASWDKLDDVGQRSQSTWDKFEDIRQESQKGDTSDIFGQHAQNFLGQQNEEIERELGFKPQNDTEQRNQIINLWNKFDIIDSNKTKVNFEQNLNSKENNTEFQFLTNEGVHQDNTKAYSDANIVSQHESQQETNDNEYSYSSGFVNPFFNQNHKNQLSNYDNTYSEHRGVFEGNTWDSHVQSHGISQVNRQEVNNSQANIQQNPLLSFWSKYDKIETNSGLSAYMKRTDIFPTAHPIEGNFTVSITNQSSISNINHQDVLNSQQTENNTASKSQHNYQDNTQLFDDKRVPEEQQNSEKPETPKDIGRGDVGPEDIMDINESKKTQQNSEKPETPKDIGRGDVGPEDIMDINESKKTYSIPTSTLSVNTFDKQGHHKQNNTYVEYELPDDQLSVLSIPQQRNENNVVSSNKNEATSRTPQVQNKQLDNKEYNTKPQNVDHNKIDITNVLDQSHQNEVQLQNSRNLEQENINTEQENLYTFGQESQDFVQQNKIVEQQYLNEFQQTLQDFKNHNENLEQQNLYNFDQKRVLNVGKKDEDLEHYPVEQEIQSDISKQNSSLSQENIHLFRDKTVEETEMQMENLQQQNSRRQSNDTNHINNLQFINYQNEETTTINLPRVQKSVGSIMGESNLYDDEDVSLPSEQKLEDVVEQSVSFHQLEQNFAGDYEPGINSFEQNLEQDFRQQHQAAGNLRNTELQSESVIQIDRENEPQINLNKNSPTTSTSTQKTVSSQNNQKLEATTEKPGFWKSVGNKFSSAKDKLVSWFKS